MITGKPIEKTHKGQELFLISEAFFDNEVHVDSNAVGSETSQG
jgi:hypothetical protein